MKISKTELNKMILEELREYIAEQSKIGASSREGAWSKLKGRMKKAFSKSGDSSKADPAADAIARAGQDAGVPLDSPADQRAAAAGAAAAGEEETGVGQTDTGDPGGTRGSEELNSMRDLGMEMGFGKAIKYLDKMHMPMVLQKLRPLLARELGSKEMREPVKDTIDYIATGAVTPEELKDPKRVAQELRVMADEQYKKAIDVVVKRLVNSLPNILTMSGVNAKKASQLAENFQKNLKKRGILL